MSDLHDNDDLLNFDIGDGDFADGQLNEDELLLSDEDELLDEKFSTQGKNLEDDLLEDSETLAHQNAGQKDQIHLKKQQHVAEPQKPPETRKRLKRRNPAIISPEKVISKKLICDAGMSQTPDSSKKVEEEVVQVKKLKIPEKTEEFIKTQVKKMVESNKSQEVRKTFDIQKSPEVKKTLDPKNIIEVRKILEPSKRVQHPIEKEVKEVRVQQKTFPEPQKIDPKPQKIDPEPQKIDPEPQVQPKVIAKCQVQLPEHKVLPKISPEPQVPVDILLEPEVQPKVLEPAPKIIEPETASDSNKEVTKVAPKPDSPKPSEEPIESKGPEAQSSSEKVVPKEVEINANTKLLNERLENLEKNSTDNSEPSLKEEQIRIKGAPSEDNDILELDTAVDMAGQGDGEVSAPGTESRPEPEESDKRTNKFMKNYYRQGKMGLGYQPNFVNQMRPLDPQWAPGPGQNFPPGQPGPPTFPTGPPMIRPPMNQNPSMHLMSGRMSGPPQGHGPMPGPPRHPMGHRMPMQGPPGHMMGNFPSGPRAPGQFYNNFMVGSGPRPNGPPNVRQRFFFPNPNQMPNMRPPIGPNQPSKSPAISPLKQNPQMPSDSGGPPEYIPSPIIQPQGPQFHDVLPGGPGQPMGRKVLINPNFKGGVEAAKSQLIKDQFGLPFMSGPPLSDEELLRQQQEFINKNLRCVEKRRYERSPSPDYRRYSNSPSPPRYRNSYRGGRGGGDRRYYNRNNRGSPKHRNYDSNNSKDKDDDVEEDEETRAYRLQIESQKQKREEMIRQKEMRRRQAAEQKAKEIQEKDESVRLQPIVVTEKKIILNKKPKMDEEKSQENNEVVVKTSAKTNKILVKKIVNELNEKSSTPPPPIPLQTHQSHPSESSTPPLPSLSTARRIVLKPSASIKQKGSTTRVHERLENLSSKKVIADINKRKIQNILKNNSE